MKEIQQHDEFEKALGWARAYLRIYSHPGLMIMVARYRRFGIRHYSIIRNYRNTK